MLARCCAVLIFVTLVDWSATALSQQPTVVARPYDGIQAGLDAYRLGEEKRQAAVSQQLFLNDQMRFWNGYPTTSSTVYYGYLSPQAMAAYGYSGYGNGIASPLLTRANLDYTYAYGSGPLAGGYGPGGYGPGGFGPGGFGALSVFQPWPYVPANIYGYPAYYQPARQPIGQQQLQTGPNRWESHPVYDPPLTNYPPPPPVNSPWLDRTPYATPPAAPAQPLPAPVESIPPEPRSTGAAIPDAAPPGPVTSPSFTVPAPSTSPAPFVSPRRGPQER